MNIPSSLTSDDEVLEILEKEYCKPAGCSLDVFFYALRTPPLTTVLRFNQHSSATEEEKIYSEEEQERIIREDLQVTNRNRLSGRSLKIRQIPGIPDTWICEVESGNIGGNLISEEFSEDIAKSESKVIVDVSAGEALLRGSNLFAPGVLACSPNMRCGQRVSVVCNSVFCDVKRKCLKGRIAEFTDELYFVGSGLAEFSRSQLFSDQLESAPPVGIAVRIDRPRHGLISLNEFLFQNSMMTSQNLPSCVAVQVLDPKINETILDCCAAPGGKTLHIASLMAATGRVIALDKSVERARKLTELVKKFKNVQVFCADVSKIFETDPKKNSEKKIDPEKNSQKIPENSQKKIHQEENSQKIPKNSQKILENSQKKFDPEKNSEISEKNFDPEKFDLPREFDRILVDAPCSASGQRPRLSLHSLHPKQLDACPKVQKRILKSVIPLLKSGGKLVYSTCSILTRENEDVVAWILREFPELSLCEQKPRFGNFGFVVPGLNNQQSSLLQRFSMLPGVEGDTIGFFIALFEKIS